VIIAILILLLALVGVLPFTVAVPLALVTTVIGASAGYLLQRRLKRIPPSNGAEAMTGKTAKALTRIEHDGTIRYGSELWNARTVGPAILEGQTVTILRIRGLRATVEAARLDSGS